MAGVLVLMVIVVILSSGLDRVEKQALRWRPKRIDGAAAP